MRIPPIIFRDVKPGNIMRATSLIGKPPLAIPNPFNRRAHLYLIDFGIARHFTAGKARDTGPLGFPGYAAPEQYGKAQTTV
jgi:eukaryotic-like serine/threonine-protein kinase